MMVNRRARAIGARGATARNAGLSSIPSPRLSAAVGGLATSDRLRLALRPAGMKTPMDSFPRLRSGKPAALQLRIHFTTTGSCDGSGGATPGWELRLISIRRFTIPVNGRNGTVRLKLVQEAEQEVISSHKEITVRSVLWLLAIGITSFAAAARAEQSDDQTQLPGVPWPATDALGRSTPTGAEPAGPRANRTVCMFYFLWHGAHEVRRADRDGPFDISQILAADGDARPSPTRRYGGHLEHRTIGASHFTAIIGATIRGFCAGMPICWLTLAWTRWYSTRPTPQSTATRSWSCVAYFTSCDRKASGRRKSPSWSTPQPGPRPTRSFMNFTSRACSASCGSSGRENRC